MSACRRPEAEKLWDEEHRESMPFMSPSPLRKKAADLMVGGFCHVFEFFT